MKRRKHDFSRAEKCPIVPGKKAGLTFRPLDEVRLKALQRRSRECGERRKAMETMLNVTDVGGRGGRECGERRKAMETLKRISNSCELLVSGMR
jgi:hypothetical protein